ncbi:Rho GTPase [Zygosaccharomyces mellis]|uniref:GTP-binding protein RHO4 n=1 Tax=Zygosaccharomyces mellis TaxID=42258 RepID=A0A4C2E2C5_9SACH|nr:Rho GTPase [Zygosaccharomyces mellis]
MSLSVADSDLFKPSPPSQQGADFQSAISYETTPVGGKSTALEDSTTPAPFSRTLSSIPSYEQVKRTNKMPDCHLKIVVVGDGAVGKTCLLISYVQRRFPTDYVPTVFENYVTKIQGPRNKIIELALWDTAGQEEYSRLRPLSYSEVDMLLVCYAANNLTSLQNVEDLWFPEVTHFCPDVPIMLVGLKADLYAQDDTRNLVDPREAESLALKLGAFVHIQCSAKTRSNVEQVFTTAMDTALHDILYEPEDSSSGIKNPFKRKSNAGGKRGIRKHKCIVL